MSMYECRHCGSDESNWPDFILVDFRVTDSGFRNNIWLESGHPGCNEHAKYEKYLDKLYRSIYNKGLWFCSPECTIKYIVESRESKENAETFLLRQRIRELELALERIKQQTNYVLVKDK